MRKGLNIRILKNYEETGYEVFIEGNRADADQENSILYAARKELREKLPVSEKINMDRIKSYRMR